MNTQKDITEQLLVGFGNYLLSSDRVESFKQNPLYPNLELLQERLSLVNDADIANFKESLSEGDRVIFFGEPINS